MAVNLKQMDFYIIVGYVVKLYPPSSVIFIAELTDHGRRVGLTIVAWNLEAKSYRNSSLAVDDATAGTASTDATRSLSTALPSSSASVSKVDVDVVSSEHVGSVS